MLSIMLHALHKLFIPNNPEKYYGSHLRDKYTKAREVKLLNYLPKDTQLVAVEARIKYQLGSQIHTLSTTLTLGHSLGESIN